MNKIFKIILNIFRSFSIPTFSFIISLFGISYFGKTDWGEFIYYFTWIVFLAFICGFGNKEYLLRSYSKSPSQISKFFTRNIISRSVLTLLSLALFLVFPFNIALASFVLLLLLFIYQSFESLIIYNQKFLLQIITEVIGFIIIIAILINISKYNIETLIYTFCLSFFIKICILAYFIKDHFSFKHVQFSINELKHSFSFFLILFSGWIASKIDLYIVNLTVSKDQISEYQIGITAFLLLQSISYLIISPYSKHIYRVNKKVIKKFKRILSITSIPLVLFGSCITYIILEKVVQLNLPLMFYILGGLSALPTYFFIIDIIMFYRYKKEIILMKINFFAALLNLVLTFILIKYLGISGALLSVFITQCVLLIIFKSKNENIASK